jgi:hypothetical protein
MKDITIAELVLKFMEHASTYYVDPITKRRQVKSLRNIGFRGRFIARRSPQIRIRWRARRPTGTRTFAARQESAHQTATEYQSITFGPSTGIFAPNLFGDLTPHAS